jgi:hypothetical protein
MNSGPKFPIERRRQDISQDIVAHPVLRNIGPTRREGDQIRARLQRWVQLADAALGRAHAHPNSHKHSSRH